MRTVELFRLSSSALTRHKMRAFLTLLGVIIGVATVVGVVSVISGLNSYVKDKLFGLNPDIVIFTKYGIITSREEWLIARKRRDITLTDMEIIRRECRLCEQVGGRGDRTRPVKYLDRKLADVEIQGHTANMGEAMSFDIATGRYFTSAEYDHASAVGVIGWDVQDQLFPHVDPVGRVHGVEGLRVVDASIMPDLPKANTHLTTVAIAERWGTAKRPMRRTLDWEPFYALAKRDVLSAPRPRYANTTSGVRAISWSRNSASTPLPAIAARVSSASRSRVSASLRARSARAWPTAPPSSTPRATRTST